MKVLFVSATDLEHGQTEVQDHQIHIIGIGKVNAAVNTALLVSQLEPDLVVNFGSAASRGRYIDVGEVCLINSVSQDIDARPFAPYGTVPFSNKGTLKISDRVGFSCFSTDQFYHKENDYSPAYNQAVRTHDFVDMELYSIVSACNALNVPVVAFKWLSDRGDAVDWKANAASGFEVFCNMDMNLDELVLHAVNNPI